MGEKSVYAQIKKQNGEAFAQEIRRFHNGIFELPNLKNIVKYAGRNAKPILEYLLFLKQKSEKGNTITSIPSKNPIELLEKAGYKAYVADTFKKQNAIRKYFAEDEELCTFDDPHRFQKYYIINAVKENVDQIKRENFLHPKREDEYGTSVLSIQISKLSGALSIKNRYNHTVQNPDNTFNSNPDKIIPGLSKALEHYFNILMHPEDALDLPDNYIVLNNQVIHYIEEREGVYFGDHYYVKDDILHELNQDYQIRADNFIIDLKNKEISSPLPYTHDSFSDVLNAEIKGKKLALTCDDENNHYLFADNVQIMKINAKHEMTELCLPTAKEIPEYFLMNNKVLEKFSAHNALYINDNFLYNNKKCHSLYLPKVLEIGDHFLEDTTKLSGLDLPSVQEIGDNFLYENENCTSLNLPNVQIIGCHFLNYNHLLKELNAPKLEIIGDDFLKHNQYLEKIDLPSVRKIGNNFLYENENCTSVNLPNTEVIGNGFLHENELLTELNAPKLEKIGDESLYYNQNCTSLNIPNNCIIGEDFLYSNSLKNMLIPDKIKIASLKFDKNSKNSLSFLYILRSLYDFAQAKRRSIRNCFLRRNQNERS